jgi:hypothetical protein
MFWVIVVVVLAFISIVGIILGIISSKGESMLKEKERRRKQSKTGMEAKEYFRLLDKIQESKSEGKFDKMLEYCSRSLELIDSLITDTKQQYMKFDIKTIPAIEIGATYWAALGEKDKLQELKEIVDTYFDLKPWKDIVEEALSDMELANKIYNLVKGNEAIEQKNLKDILVEDSGDISSVCYNMAAMGRIRRKKKGNTYILTV